MGDKATLLPMAGGSGGNHRERAMETERAMGERDWRHGYRACARARVCLCMQT